LGDCPLRAAGTDFSGSDMKAFVIALALAGLYPAPADAPPSVTRASSAPVKREPQRTEPSAWILGLTGILAIALMQRPRR